VSNLSLAAESPYGGRRAVVMKIKKIDRDFIYPYKIHEIAEKRKKL
jgi:hypothetical protein